MSLFKACLRFPVQSPHLHFFSFHPECSAPSQLYHSFSHCAFKGEVQGRAQRQVAPTDRELQVPCWPITTLITRVLHMPTGSTQLFLMDFSSDGKRRDQRLGGLQVPGVGVSTRIRGLTSPGSYKREWMLLVLCRHVGVRGRDCVPGERSAFFFFSSSHQRSHVPFWRHPGCSPRGS